MCVSNLWLMHALSLRNCPAPPTLGKYKYSSLLGLGDWSWIQSVWCTLDQQTRTRSRDLRLSSTESSITPGIWSDSLNDLLQVLGIQTMDQGDPSSPITHNLDSIKGDPMPGCVEAIDTCG